MAIPVSVVIVTHNSAAVLETCLGHLEKQIIPAREIIVVDSGSNDTGYLQKVPQSPGRQLIKTANIGYGRANNLGFQQMTGGQEGIVIFLNPDTFLPPDFIAQTIAVFRENPGAGVISGKLLGYDPQVAAPTGKLDSTGIYRRWYGRWYDRGQGKKDNGQYDLISTPRALCGALLCCRGTALAPYAGVVFDPDFFLYKEDIEFCLRLRKDGWSVVYDPRLVGYHCRGWSQQRCTIPFALRLIAAESEILLYKKHPGPHILWAWLKYMAVRFFRC